MINKTSIFITGAFLTLVGLASCYGKTHSSSLNEAPRVSARTTAGAASQHGR